MQSPDINVSDSADLLELRYENFCAEAKNYGFYRKAFMALIFAILSVTSPTA